MASRIRGRHRRPSQAGKVIGTVAGGGITAGVIIAATAGAAQAQPVTPAPSFHPVLVVAAANHTPEVTVQRGQYLSGIAGKDCGNPLDWTGIYDANDKVIGKNPDMIEAGQRLVLSCKTGWAPSPPVVTVYRAPRTAPKTYSAPSAGYSAPVRTYSAPVVSTAGDGSFESCVIARESGGNSQVMNSTGHYGLFQFSSSTWAAHGGNPADFGHASAAEQTQVFYNTVREDGTSDWQPYDGCT